MSFYDNPIVALTLALPAALLTHFTPLYLIISVLICLNLKMMPLAHMVRSAPSLARLFLYPTGPPPSDALFRPGSIRSRACMLECDVNLHKSNSTYLIDLDISRAELLTRLLSHGLRRTGARLVLAGIDISFRREIRPLQAYETHSRILAWDNKWIYVLSYHTEPGIVVDKDAGEDSLGWLEALLGKAESVKTQSKTAGLVFTVSVSKYVAKAGRRTVPPHELLKAGGLLHSTESETRRANSLDILLNTKNLLKP